MTPDEIVTKFCKSFETGDAAGAIALLADDCVYHNIPLEPLRGKDAIAQTLAGFGQMLGSIVFEIRHQVAKGDVVMNERVDWFTPPGKPKYGLPVTGVFEVKNGKITAWRDYFDTRQFSQGTGMAL